MIYFLRHPSTGNIKIGFTINFDARYQAHVRRHGTVDVLGCVEGDIYAEKQLHRQFSAYRVQMHMFECEWYAPCDALLRYISEHAKPVNEVVESSDSINPLTNDPIVNSPAIRDFLQSALINKRAADKKKHTQRDIASDLGLPEWLISLLMRGQIRRRDRSNLKRLANWLGCSIDELVHEMTQA